jgi:hypothetical protein
MGVLNEKWCKRVSKDPPKKVVLDSLAVFDFGHFWKKEKCPFYKNGIQNFAKNVQKA